MNPNDDPELAALDAFGTQMRRGRFKDALPEEEQRQITLIISPGGQAQIVSDTGADDMGEMSPDDEMAEMPGAPDEDEALDLP
jgi:hypothetical protein